MALAANAMVFRVKVARSAMSERICRRDSIPGAESPVESCSWDALDVHGEFE